MRPSRPRPLDARPAEQILRRQALAQRAMMAWRQRAGPAERSQGREPAEPVARSASLDGAPLVRQRPPMRSWPDIMPSTRGKPLRCDGWRSGYWFRTPFSLKRHWGVLHGAVTVPSKTLCRQTLTTLDGTERHRRFYLAVEISSPPTSHSRAPTLPRLRQPSTMNVIAQDAL